MSTPNASSEAASLVLVTPGDPPAPDTADPAVSDLPSLHHAEIATARRYADADAMLAAEGRDFGDIATTLPSHRPLVELQ